MGLRCARACACVCVSIVLECILGAYGYVGAAHLSLIIFFARSSLAGTTIEDRVEYTYLEKKIDREEFLVFFFLLHQEE